MVKVFEVEQSRSQPHNQRVRRTTDSRRAQKAPEVKNSADMENLGTRIRKQRDAGQDNIMKMAAMTHNWRNMMLLFAFGLPCVFLYRATHANFASAAVVEVLSGVGIAICGMSECPPADTLPHSRSLSPHTPPLALSPCLPVAQRQLCTKRFQAEAAPSHRLGCRCGAVQYLPRYARAVRGRLPAGHVHYHVPHDAAFHQADE